MIRVLLRTFLHRGKFIWKKKKKKEKKKKKILKRVFSGEEY